MTGTAVYVCTDPGVPVLGTKGSSTHVCAVLTELLRRYDDVHLVTCRLGGTPTGGLRRLAVHELPLPTGDAAERERQLVALDGELAGLLDRIVGAAEPDLVYQRYSLWSCAAMQLAAARRWRSVLEINAPLIDEQDRHRRLVDRPAATVMSAQAIRHAGFAFAVSRGVADWGSRLAGRPVAVIPNGVDPSRFDGTDGADAAARTARRHRPPTVGFVGTFKPWHDLDTVVDVAAALADGRGESPRLLLVGDGPELARIRDRITALGLAETTETTGAVDADEIPGLLSRMDVALAPYTRDEQYFSPLKVFEYLAAGVAVVASRIDGLSGDLVDGREALVVEPGDRPSFVAAVQRLCTDRDLACALGRRGRAAARQRFCWDQTVDRILGAANAAAVA